MFGLDVNNRPDWSSHKWTAPSTSWTRRNGGRISDPNSQTTLRGVLGCMWPHSFSSVYRHVSWATLKDRLLNWHPLWNNKMMKKPQRHAEWIPRCLISRWFSVMQITCLGALNLPMLAADVCEHAICFNHRLPYKQHRFLRVVEWGELTFLDIPVRDKNSY